MPFALECDLLRRPGRSSPRCCSTDGFGTGKYREGWGEKFWGKAPLRIGDQPCLWFHAVSVGEVLLLRPLVREMARRRPNWEVVISTTTSTGLAVARRTYPRPGHLLRPAGLQLVDTARRSRGSGPTVLALVELELWPNLIRAAKRAGAKVAIINARLSSRSYRGYRSCARPLQPTLGRIDAVAAQNAEYAGDSSSWESRAIGSASPARSSTTGWRATGTTQEPASCGKLLGSGPDRPGLRGRQHDGGGGGGGAGGLQRRAAAASELAADPGAPPRRAVRERGRSGWSSRARRSSAAAGSERCPRPTGHERPAPGHP